MYNNYFHNKVVLITGAGSGIGRGLCLQLATEGAIVFCTDIDIAKAIETESMAINGNIIAQKLDVAIITEFENIVTEIVNRHGRLDLIFNNAGIAVSGEIRDIDIEQWKKIVDINFYGVLNGSLTAYRQMLKQGSGQIVNIASAAGLIDYLALMAPYSVTKHAIVNYTKILRIEAKKLGVKANVVCPGFISTSIGENAINPHANTKWNEHAINEVAKGITIQKAVHHILKGVAANTESLSSLYR
ncbi:NADP-dependent 3-hydroxy acid dehydrogenase YdfG [Mucilaginibacter frigoritolerans]|uniref:NADP-dependent 3-hydroxy acid dehydrogenase YdfG n=1 Tax=Mucilaginibacter frigoritolerans TaxID=652788 RepID=A0A562TN34_9SPHI|nr:SDR family oxidoreductase [Mucilaginibacter frigoritolerans]TWI94833.1 NADP-dependent 3-hydroxy acid dehydrogenase YdfG [Mucilaginibacter frigoritolerans]